MRSAMPILGVSAALVAAVALSTPASASSTGAAIVHGKATSVAAVPAKKACYTNTGTDSGTGIISTDTTNPTGWSSVGAIDFTVKKKCSFNTVLATGVYAAGSGPADSFTVTISKNKKGLPGKIVNQQTVDPNSGSPDLALTVKTVKLNKGKYFLSVQGSMDYTAKGAWYWETTSTVEGGVDLWENYGKMTGHCFTWDTLANCFSLQSDFIASLVNS